ncbi:MULTISPECIES: mechanosensitive channel MscK [Tenebrionibacter/Tenebrionicola group]|jgi:potassium efflux system protein|uniref:Mechanosensitive channel MscK n=2 Tax=Tenebrionibacter/Tenebrionicola group TaxID=2969848 RepID=A0A8K0V2B7_9ENTR|nr:MULTISPECIES: mechanosensitive channel MscK [Tenebrionibacter/Tenebrionicola group]MBK4715718.1 mechanosensitive channel MscK [Tenebrionibacter intestinalis]MBV5096298.1 mechanosensitive channel MscK [Tenebrionicola larvae]
MTLQHALRLRKTAFAVVIIFVSLFQSLAVQARANSDVPSRSDIQRQLDALDKQKNLSSQARLIQQDLNQTLEVLDKIERVENEAAEQHKRINDAPEKTRRATEALEAYGSEKLDEAAYSKTLSSLSLRQLEQQVSQTFDELQTAQSALSTLNSQLVSLQTQPERVQNAMYAATEQLQQIRSRLSGVNTGAPLRASQQSLLLAQQALLNAQLEQQRGSLEGNTMLQDSLQKQRDYTTAHISRLERRLELMQATLSKKRLTLTKKTAQEAVTPEEGAAIQNIPLVRQELDVNHQISERLIDATRRGNELVQRNIQVKTWLDRTLQSERNLKEQIAMLKGSLLLSRILYQQQQNLPSADDMDDMTNRIADLRLEQFELNQQRDALFRGEDFVNHLLQSQPKEQRQSADEDDVRDALLEVIDMRRELLEQLNKQLGGQLMLAINLQMNQQQLISSSQRLQQTLTQQIFWVTSNKPMDWAWITAFPQALKDQLSSMEIVGNWGGARHSFGLTLAAALALLMLAGLTCWRFRWLKARLDALSADVGLLHKDSQTHTPKALLIDLVRALPVCLMLLAAGLLLRFMRLNVSELMWSFGKELALFGLIFGVCWRVLEQKGVAEHHFMIPPTRVRHYRRQIVRISIALLPMLCWAVVGAHSPLHLMNDVLGQFMVFVNLLVITGLMWPMCRDAWRDKESHTVRLVTITVLSLVPVGLLILTALGYFYTTLRLAHRWIDTVYLTIIWNLLYQTVLRGLSVAARRIAWRRALARREALEKEGAQGSNEPVEEPPLGLEQVNQQTLRITTLVMFALFGLIFWAIWSDLITVFSYLDSITLWHYSVTEAGASVTKSVTMGSLLFAVVAFMLAWALIRNLPGLLEVLVLSRLKMRQGSSYAITTILNYVIIAAGAIAVLGSLGVSWDKLQWMAAGLSVGLGFGLQEIFGNFIAGLIILFERPIRIGDTITIGTYSGSVSRIRIRATTIIDFDHKEIIVPNKAFVTERLINWSLSDTITRVVVKLGVAYGSDLDKVQAVLLKAATGHPKVMHEPYPQVFFLAFGQSSLDHELQFYVRELGDRGLTQDAVNRTIDRLCRENSIDIAFNTLEVRLRNAKGDEITEVARDLSREGQGDTPPSL